MRDDFHKVMDPMLAHLQVVHVYQDDILIATRWSEERQCFKSAGWEQCRCKMYFFREINYVVWFKFFSEITVPVERKIDPNAKMKI